MVREPVPVSAMPKGAGRRRTPHPAERVLVARLTALRLSSVWSDGALSAFVNILPAADNTYADIIVQNQPLEKPLIYFFPSQPSPPFGARRESPRHSYSLEVVSYGKV